MNNSRHHQDSAEEALRRADACMSVDSGWADHDMSERLLYRSTCISEAQVHATLAQVAVQVEIAQVGADLMEASVRADPVAAAPADTDGDMIRVHRRPGHPTRVEITTASGGTMQLDAVEGSDVRLFGWHVIQDGDVR